MTDSTPSSGHDHGPEARITPRLIDSLYTEAMILADEARAYFDEAGRDDRLLLGCHVLTAEKITGDEGSEAREHHR